MSYNFKFYVLPLLDPYKTGNSAYFWWYVTCTQLIKYLNKTLLRGLESSTQLKWLCTALCIYLEPPSPNHYGLTSPHPTI